MEPRLLIVNADDLGLCKVVDEGIFAAHATGIVTSASLMVRRPSAPAAARRAAELSELGVGLHLDLDGVERVEEESRAQLQLFRSLLGRDPTHLDSHHHLHLSGPVAAVAVALADELGVPLRGRDVRYEGGFYGRNERGEARPEAIAPAALVELISALPAGWTEIGCHPAAGPVPGSSYDRERLIELETLRDPGVRAALERSGVELCSFSSVR